MGVKGSILDLPSITMLSLNSWPAYSFSSMKK